MLPRCRFVKSINWIKLFIARVLNEQGFLSRVFIIHIYTYKRSIGLRTRKYVWSVLGRHQRYPRERSPSPRKKHSDMLKSIVTKQKKYLPIQIISLILIVTGECDTGDAVESGPFINVHCAIRGELVTVPSENTNRIKTLSSLPENSVSRFRHFNTALPRLLLKCAMTINLTHKRLQ